MVNVALKRKRPERRIGQHSDNPRRLRRSLSRLISNTVLAALLACYVFLINGWPRGGPLFGDDFLLVNEARLPSDAPTALRTVFWTGLNKWRPISTVPLLQVSRWWGFNYFRYEIVNTFLLVIVALVACAIVKSLTKSYLLGIAFAFVVVSLPFSWYFQYSLYGLMESISLIAFLTFILLMSTGLGDSCRINRWTPLALLIATLGHERYLFVVPFVWAFLMFAPQIPVKLRKTTTTYLWIFIGHIMVRVVLLDIDPMTGGGESSLRDGAGIWIVRHLADAIIASLNFTSPLGKYYNKSTFAVLSNDSSIGFVAVIPLIAVAALLLAGVIKAPVPTGRRDVGTLQIFLFLPVMALSLLLPAATVSERIEGRWIFGPQIVVFIALVSATSRITARFKSRTLSLLATSAMILSLVWPSLFYQQDRHVFNALRDQTIDVLNIINDEHALNGARWGAIVSQSDATIPVSWQFGYGAAFSQLKNAPKFVGFAGSIEACPTLAYRYVCVLFRLDKLNTQVAVHKKWIDAKS